MTANPKLKRMSSSRVLKRGRRIEREFFDIIECALNNDFEGVERALQRDPSDINAQRSDNGITALMGASGRGLDRMVVHLLGKDGIDVKLVDDRGRNAFDHARVFPRIVAILMEHAYPDLAWKEPPPSP